ncbi:hypothetical protein RBB50_001129 [Rhinocladiella similis]
MGNHTYSDGPHPSHLDLLNAALIVIYLQISIQDKLTRRRICGKRFPALVAAAKGLCLFSARHDIYQLRSQLPTARRRSWLKVESMIRLASGIFLLDCELSIFYRNAPSIMLVEMDGDLPSREDVFSAESVDGWMASIPLDTLELRSSVSSVVEQLLHDTWEESVRTDTPMISVHGLFLVLCGLLHLIYLSQTNHISTSGKHPLVRAVERWKKLWEEKEDTSNIDAPGDFVRATVGSEYGWLAHVLLQEKPYQNLPASDPDPLESLSDLLNKVCSPCD